MCEEGLWQRGGFRGRPWGGGGDGFSGMDCGLTIGGRGFLFEEEAMAEVDSGRPWQGRGWIHV